MKEWTERVKGEDIVVVIDVGEWVVVKAMDMDIGRAIVLVSAARCQCVSMRRFR